MIQSGGRVDEREDETGRAYQSIAPSHPDSQGHTICDSRVVDARTELRHHSRPYDGADHAQNSGDHREPYGRHSPQGSSGESKNTAMGFSNDNVNTDEKLGN
jgi:hypothetical protein